MFIGSWGLVACGGGGDARPDADIVLPADASDDDPDASQTEACNPVENTGCEAGEKCSVQFEQEDPLLGRVTCVPDGNVPAGGMCEFGEIAMELGYDNCVGGSFCLSGRCTEICSRNPDSCPTGESACGLYTIDGDYIFGDNTVGLCDPVCDPLDATSCLGEGPDFACYLSLSSGLGTCAGVFEEGQQNAVCTFVNSCGSGLGCVLQDTQGNGLCAHFCDPMTAMTAQGLTCAQVPEIAGGTPTCAQINMFYGNVPNVPDAVGMCIDCSNPDYTELAVCNPAAP